MGGRATYDLVQATSKRLHQLLILLRCRAYTRAVFNAQPGSLRGCLIQPFLCFCMQYLEMYHCRQAVGFYIITQKERKAQWDWSTKLLRWDLPSARVRGRAEYKSQRLKREAAAQGTGFSEQRSATPSGPKSQVLMLHLPWQ